MERNEPCWCGSGKKYKKCHMPIDEKIQLHADHGEIVPSRAILKTPAQIEMIRKSADLNTAVLDEVAKHIRIGMSTAEIDEIVYRFTTEHGGIPAPLNYQGFPKSVCTSLNNEICHGIPDENIMIQDGDIINVDVSTILNGYFSDASRMFKMGNVSERAERLVRVTEECVQRGLAAAKPWGHLGDIADAINTHAQANGYSVVEEIGGHGIGRFVLFHSHGDGVHFADIAGGVFRIQSHGMLAFVQFAVRHRPFGPFRDNRHFAVVLIDRLFVPERGGNVAHFRGNRHFARISEFGSGGIHCFRRVLRSVPVHGYVRNIQRSVCLRLNRKAHDRVKIHIAREAAPEHAVHFAVNKADIEIQSMPFSVRND